MSQLRFLHRAWIDEFMNEWSGGNQQQDEEYSSPFQLPKPYVGTLESFQLVPPLPQEHFSEKTGFQ